VQVVVVVEQSVDKHQLDLHAPGVLAKQKSEFQSSEDCSDCPVECDRSSFFAQELVVAVACRPPIDRHALDEQATDFARLSW
jgi:hypothetical protein